MNDNQKWQVVKRSGVKAVLIESLVPFADQIIDGVDRMMADGLILKKDHTCDVSMASAGGIEVIIKRYNYKGLAHMLRQNFKPSRARRCWIWGRRLLSMGVATPEPFGYIEVRKCGLRKCSYLLTEYLTGGKDFAEALKDAGDDNERSRLSKAVNEVVETLEKNCILHSDLKPPNVMISCGKPYLIDLDSMRKITFFTSSFDKGKDRAHLVRKLKRQGVVADERFNMMTR